MNREKIKTRQETLKILILKKRLNVDEPEIEQEKEKTDTNHKGNRVRGIQEERVHQRSEHSY